jgi:phospholipid/cholesterol/gamma-HCH transport system substrate-binding protein
MPAIMNRNTRRRTSREPTPTRNVVAGILVLCLVAAFVASAVRSSSKGLPGINYRTLYASVPDVGSLRPHDEVRIAGVRQGEVMEVAAHHGKAKVKIRLDAGNDPLPVGTRAGVRGRGLLGTRFLELIPGDGPGTLGEDATVHATKDSLSYGVADALDTFDDKTRDGMQRTVGGLGGGVLGRGWELNTTVRLIPQAADRFISLTAPLIAEPGQLRELLPSLRSASGAVDGARNDLVAALRPVQAGLDPFVRSEEDLHDVLDSAPQTLLTARTGLDAGRKLLKGARDLSYAAGRTLPKAPSALNATTALLRASPTPLARTRELLKAADPAIPAVLKITRHLSPNLRPLSQALTDLDEPVSILARHRCDVANMTSNWRSVLNQATVGTGTAGVGPLTTFRLDVIAGVESIGGGSLGGQSKPIYMDRDTYPAPCKYSPQTYDTSGLDTARPGSTTP